MRIIKVKELTEKIEEMFIDACENIPNNVLECLYNAKAKENSDLGKEVIDRIAIPAELGYLEPAGKQLNGPSAKVLDDSILAPLGYDRKSAWLCDCLPETRINSSQAKVIKERYEPLMEQYGLNPVTIPNRPTAFCDQKRAEEITAELMESKAELLILLGDIPLAQYLKKVTDVPYSTLGEYVDLHGYGKATNVVICGKTIKVLPLAHPRQIGALGAHSEKWFKAHREWEKKAKTEDAP